MNCLYLHIPFCRAKCLYCSFNSYPGQGHLYRRYCRDLQREIHSCQLEQPLDSLFIGGGTPTVLGGNDLIDLLDCCKERFGFVEAAEISLEANPETVDLKTLQKLRKAGFNRISFGVQSFDDAELKTLGRIHSAAAARKAVTDACKAGFGNLSIDLMYGLPGQRARSWKQTLNRALDLGPTHLSAYQLSIEAETVFASLTENNQLEVVEEDAIAEMDEATGELCWAAGLQHYEISNYARTGYQCRHNLNYWHNDGYLACGAGAVSYQEGVRAARIRDPEHYCRMLEQEEDVISEREKLDPGDSFKETVIMGLRLISGISERRLQKRYGLSLSDVYGSEMDRLIDQNLLDYDGSYLKLTDRGLLFANQVMAVLV